ncbi:hypothetical protein DM01DRAFT_1331816 [Hesseltinella vesiculosa]|uniref:UBA domain-containing protein n=1 Tax=Hesseltinella vesiculosa TaxID=101127 RepID=A0A1X2GWG3_9FUNG|nr:hypothetical protein DM01DRAFT_1331816 [Hesseltinella vesiculosa]
MSKKRQSQANKQVDLNDIEHLLHDTLHDDFDDNDLNDPDLLAQLQSLTSSSATAPPPKKKQQPSEPVSMDIDWESYAALTQDHDVNVTLDENDFNDPQLLNELSSLQETAVKATPTASAPANDQAVDQLLQMGFGMRQAKQALAMFDQDVKQATNYLLDQVPDDTATVGAPPAALAPVDEPMDEADDTIADAKTQALHYQQLALQAKKQGDKKKAVALLRESKALMKQYEQDQDQLRLLAEEGSTPAAPVPEPAHPSSPAAAFSPAPLARQDSDTSDDNVPLQQHGSFPAAPDAAQQPGSAGALQEVAMDLDRKSESSTEDSRPSSIPPAATVTDAAPVTTTPAPVSPAVAPVEQRQQVLQRIIQLQKEYKDAAHHYKDLGNLAAAKDMVKMSKSLLKTGLQVKQQPQLLARDVERIDQQLPAPPDLTLGDGKWRATQSPLAPSSASASPHAAKTPPSTRDQVEAQLVYQADVCHNLALQLAQPNSPFHPLEQTFHSHLVKLRALAADDSLPTMHYEQVDYAIQRTNDHLPLNQMELKITNGLGIQSMDIATAIEPFVTWDLSGWPPENTAQSHLSKGETPVAKGTSPAFDFQLLIPITRTNRVFMRYLQRKKITLEVYHNRYNYGFLRRPVFVGKVAIPLDALLTKTSISGWFDLVDSNRRPMGGKLEIAVNLRQPLQGQDVVQKSEPWLVLDGWTPDVSEHLYNVGLAHTRYQTATRQTPSSLVPDPTSPTSSTPSAIPSTPQPSEDRPSAQSISTPPTDHAKPKQEAPTNEALEAAEEELNNVDVLVSNMVLEHEMNVVQTTLSTGKYGPGRTKDDWMDRKQALDIKMNMLVIQVQTGILDMAGYLEQVQERMDRDRQLAILFKKHDRLDLAKTALTRKKIMQDELEEAKEAMANQ